MSTPVFSVVVETCGPWGDAFAVGASVREGDRELDALLAWHPLEATVGYDRLRWRDVPELRARVVPLLLASPVCATPREMRARFWAFYVKWRRATVITGGVGVVDRLFHMCATEAGVAWRPYEFSLFGTPIVDHGVFVKPDRRADERPEGHPLCEARRTSRLWISKRA